jgi:AcrR family transcriptional regulator
MPRLSAARRSARRRQILDGALRCFARVGFSAATMGDIAAAAGLSAANLYRHFASKDALVEAIALDRHRRESALIDAAFEGMPAPAALHGLCDSYLAWLRDPDERLRRRVGVGVWAHGLHDPQAGAVMRRGMNQHRRLARHLADAKRRGELPASFDTASVARLLLAVFQGVILQQAYEPRLALGPIAATVHRLVDGLTSPARSRP